MPNLVNELLLKTYMERFADVAGVVAVGYPGMKANDIHAFRDKLAAAGIALTVVKNRIVNLAFKELGLPEVAPICQGQTAFATGEDVVALARFMVDFRKEQPLLQIHGAMVEGTILDEPATVALSKSPTKEELKGQIAGQALAPGSNLSGALVGPARLIAGQIKAHIEKLEDGGEAAA